MREGGKKHFENKDIEPEKLKRRPYKKYIGQICRKVIEDDDIKKTLDLFKKS